jgi:hypothetical protein
MMSLDLNKLENKLDEALSNETSETLNKFLNDKRMTNNKQQTAVRGDFLPYELALELKQLGFDEPCFKYIYTGDTGNNVNIPCEVVPSSAKNYNEDDLCVSTPTYSQAFRWFREKHQLIHHMYWVYKKKYDGIDWIFHIKGINMINNNVVPHDETRFETYEEAELACLKKLIEIVKTYGGGEQ